MKILNDREVPCPMHSCLSELPDAPATGLRIWTADLDSLSPAAVGQLGTLLDATERARAARFHFERDRQHYIATHGLLRNLLGDTLNQSASTLTFQSGPYGKPALAAEDRHCPNLGFNLSHSGDWAMFALAWDREVGIDLETITHVEGDEDELSGLAARIFSTREMTHWRALPKIETRRAAFLRAWTRKEAYAKAIGKGVADELRHIELVLDAAAPKPSLIVNLSRKGEGRTRDWAIHDLPAPEGFAAAVAFNKAAA